MEDAYEPPSSLWSLIEAHVNPCELDTIKDTIGASLVDQSLELHQEVLTLLDIWRDFRLETDYSDRGPSLSPTSSSKSLPEPPDVRERLVKEIKFLVKEMREMEGAQFHKNLTANQHNLSVINYVLNEKLCDSDTLGATHRSKSARPGTSMSKFGTETPMVPPQSHRCHLSEVDATLETVEEKLNSFEIDEIVDKLRQRLSGEVYTLLKDIDFLYECIDRESEYRADSARVATVVGKEPTLGELKEERKRLETSLLSKSASTPLGFSISKMPSRPTSNTSVNSIALSVRSNVNSPTLGSSRADSSSSLLRSKVPLTVRSKVDDMRLKPDAAKRSLERLVTPASVRSGSVTRATPASRLNTGLASPKTSAAEKFRKMVLNSRDSP